MPKKKLKKDVKKLDNVELLDSYKEFPNNKDFALEILRRMGHAPDVSGQRFSVQLEVVTECEETLSVGDIKAWFTEQFEYSDMGRVTVEYVHEGHLINARTALRAIDAALDTLKMSLDAEEIEHQIDSYADELPDTFRHLAGILRIIQKETNDTLYPTETTPITE